MFDRLHLLSDGQTIFFGKTGDAVKYFEEIGWKCPPLWNAADFLLDLIATVRMWCEKDAHLAHKPLDLTLFLILALGLSIGGGGEGNQGPHRCPLPEELGKGRPVHMRANWAVRYRYFFSTITTQRLGT